MVHAFNTRKTKSFEPHVKVYNPTKFGKVGHDQRRFCGHVDGDDSQIIDHDNDKLTKEEEVDGKT